MAPKQKVSSGKQTTTESGVIFKKQCKFIGSIAITLLNGEERQKFVNEKLYEMKDMSKGISVVLMITDEGVKVLKENESAVKMAHGITKIAFSTCQPERRLFAYVAKSLTALKTTVIQAHMFKTKKNAHSQQLSQSLSKAFRIAYARDSTRRQNRTQLFESEAAEQKPPSEIRSHGKRWAKLEMAQGHENARHALQAKGLHGSADISKLMLKLGLDEKQNSETKVLQEEENNNVQNPPFSGETRIDSPQLEKKIDKKTSREETNTSDANSSPKTKNGTNRLSKLKKISQDRGVSNSNDEIINLVPNSTTVVGPNNNIVMLPDKFAEDPVDIATYENIVLSADGYKVSDEISKGKKESVVSQVSFVKEEDTNHQNFNEQEPENYIRRSRMDISRLTMTEEELLKDSEWFQPGFSREISETVLQNRSVGSFFIRDSMTNPGNYVMSVRVPPNLKPNHVAHFLIERLEDDFFKIKGFSLTFPSLTNLISHYGSVHEDIPCQLRLANDNPLFLRRLHIDQPDAKGFVKEPSVFSDDDDEYDDPDYVNFDCNTDIMEELKTLRDK